MAIISPGNSKLGNIPNISLPPIKTCLSTAPCQRHCYAVVFYNMYPTTRAAWDANLAEVTNDREEYFRSIDRYLGKEKPPWFRWHVSGDIINQGYLACMCEIAHRHPITNFLAFTKRHDLDYSYAPQNLTIRFSYWPRWGNANNFMPKGFLKDDEEKRVTDGFLCRGNCKKCHACWDAKIPNIILKRHSNKKWVNPRQLTFQWVIAAKIPN